MAQVQGELPVEAVKRIDAICDHFEADWVAGKHPALECYISATTAEERAELLRSLLRLEIELSSTKGQAATQESYAARFPDDASIIQSVFQEVQSPSPKSEASADTSVTQDSTSSGKGQSEAARETPTKIGRFEILGVLGQGAFGRVYKGRDPHLEREVAIKVPLRDVLDTKEDVNRFLREARAAATLHHPNICGVHEVGDSGGVLYIVMRFVDGKPLSAHLRERTDPFPEKQAALILRKLAQALGVAHAKGIIHRDLKPANIMIEKENKDVIIMDFGLARRSHSNDPRQTREGAVLGTPAYMAPEQANGDIHAIGPTSDVYSLGVILYEMLAGRLPFQGTAAEVLCQVMLDDPKPPSTYRPGANPHLERICLKAMAKNPAERHVSMRALCDAIDEYLKSPTRERQVETKSQSEEAQDVGQSGDDTLRQREMATAFAGQREQDSSTILQQTTYLSRIPIRHWLTAAALVAIVVVAGIIFFARTPNATVTIIVDVDLADKTLAFSLDGKLTPAERLGVPVELSVGKHELIVKRGDTVVRHFLFAVSRDAGPQITLREEMPKNGQPPGQELSDEEFARWAVALGNSVMVKPEGQDLLEMPITNVGNLPKGRFTVISFNANHNRKLDDAVSDAFVDWLKRSGQESVNFLGTSIGDKTVEKLVKIPTLKRIALHGTKITNHSLELLSSRPDLTYVGLDGTAITNAGMAHLAKLEKVDELSFFNTRITDDGINHLAQLKNLHKLMLGSTDVAGEGIKLLKELPIEVLAIGGTRVRPTDLEHLKSFAWLRQLNVYGLYLKDDALPALLELKALDSLNLDYNRITDEGLTKLAEFKTLTELSIRENPVSEAGLDKLRKALPGCKIASSHDPKKELITDPDRRLAEWVLEVGGWVRVEPTGRGKIDVQRPGELPAGPFRLRDAMFPLRCKLGDERELGRLVEAKYLTDLSVDVRVLSNDGLKLLRRVESLKNLSVCCEVVTAAGLAPWHDHPNLQSLGLYGPIDDETMRQVGRIHRLQNLVLDTAKVTPDGLASLKALPDLRQLHIRGVSLDEAGCKLLAEIRTLRVLHASGPALTDAALAHLARLPELHQLWLFESRITDDGLRHLKEMQSVDSFVFQNSRINGEGLRHLRDLPRLEGLDLSATNFTREGAKPLGELKQVKYLNLHSSSVTDADMPHLAALTDLQTLILDRTPITDAALSHLKKLAKLKELGLQDTKVTPAMVQELAKALPRCRIVSDSGTLEPSKEAAADPDRRAAEFVLKVGGPIWIYVGDRVSEVSRPDDLPKEPFHLFGVRLFGLDIDDDALAVLNGLSRLKDVYLSGPKVTDEGLKHLASLPKLGGLRLTDTKITGAGFRYLDKADGLMVLYLGGSKVDDAGILALGKKPNLSELYLDGTAISNNALKAIATFPRLGQLGLGNTKVDDTGLAHLKDHPALVNLFLQNLPVTDEGLIHLRQLGRSQKAGMLNLSGTRISNKGLENLARFEWLIQLDLAGTKVDDDGLVHLEKMTRLQSMNLTGTQVSAAGAARLRKALPKCDITH